MTPAFMGQCTSHGEGEWAKGPGTPRSRRGSDLVTPLVISLRLIWSDLFVNHAVYAMVVMDAKYELLDATTRAPKRSSISKQAGWATAVLSATALAAVGVKNHFGDSLTSSWIPWKEEITTPDYSHSTSNTPRHLHYNLTVAQAWRNPDGGWWRPMFVGNSETPVPILNAREGDVIHLTVQNDLYLPASIHWLSLHHHESSTWHDGAAGVSTYPLLPRANWTAVLDTSDQWGAKLYTDHMTTAFFDGLYGLIWIRPSPTRQRPYDLISADADDIRDMVDAEETPEHVIVWNHQHRTYDNLLSEMQYDGYEPYCFSSALVNGKGRVHCKPDGVDSIDGETVDSYGCVKQPSGAVGYDECKTTAADYEIIETNGRSWIMFNFVGASLEHPYRISIDGHKMWIVANDAGFVQPKEVDIVTVGQAHRITVMVKLDQNPADYAIRFHALSKRQSIQGYAILRYPHRRTGLLLGSMPRPSQERSAQDLLAQPLPGFSASDASLAPYPALPPPTPATKTLHFFARGAPDPYNPHITNYTLNGAPWQLWRAFRSPLILHPNTTFPSPNPIVKSIPLGSVVDIIVHNTLPIPIPMYKHNDAVFLVGRGEGIFPYTSVAEAQADGKGDWFDLTTAPWNYLHTVPAHGWMVVRWKVERAAMTMFHSTQAAHFVMGMLVPMFEGDDAWPEVPREVRERPHVEWDAPERGGIFD
ncbi:Multicopper oxidase-like protein 8 [Elsinoe fawcettii]|nr:Multicopper oxidase-like protein 8 [Elsinoe fawcettii]